MKTWLWVAVAIVVLAMGSMAWNQHIQAVRAEAIVVTLEAERAAALAHVERLEADASNVREQVDSLTAALDVQKVEAEAVIEVLEDRADSLAQAIVGLAAPGPARDTTEALVASLRATHRAEIAEYTSLLALSDETITAIREQVAVEVKINATLREALAVTTQQRDAWRVAANPGLITRIKQDAGLLGTALAVGGVLVFVATGGGG